MAPCSLPAASPEEAAEEEGDDNETALFVIPPSVAACAVEKLLLGRHHEVPQLMWNGNPDGDLDLFVVARIQEGKCCGGRDDWVSSRSTNRE